VQRQHIDSLFTFQKILNAEELATYEKLLCLVLSVAANGETECEPTVRTLARLCSCSYHQILRTLKSLEAKGYVTRIAQFIEAENNAPTANKYILRFGR
jgi:DNA-binding MarR family transcriptional regulator